MTEALTRALVALQRLQRPDMRTDGAEAWQEVRTVITEAKALHRTALVAANAAQALCRAHDHLEEATAREDQGAQAAVRKALATLHAAKVDLKEALQHLRAAEESETASQDGSPAHREP
jgi:hypothetical protein